MDVTVCCSKNDKLLSSGRFIHWNFEEVRITNISGSEPCFAGCFDEDVCRLVDATFGEACSLVQSYHPCVFFTDNEQTGIAQQFCLDKDVNCFHIGRELPRCLFLLASELIWIVFTIDVEPVKSLTRIDNVQRIFDFGCEDTTCFYDWANVALVVIVETVVR